MYWFSSQDYEIFCSVCYETHQQLAVDLLQLVSLLEFDTDPK
jgi:hypothetical protein